MQKVHYRKTIQMKLFHTSISLKTQVFWGANTGD